MFFDHMLLVTSQLIELWFSSLNLHAQKKPTNVGFFEYGGERVRLIRCEILINSIAYGLKGSRLYSSTQLGTQLNFNS